MATRYKGNITLRGGNGKQSVKVYDLGEFDSSGTEGENFEAALDALNQIYGSLDAITEATVIETGISASVTQTPGNGAGQLHIQGLVNVFVVNENDLTDVEHKAQIYIPAPVQGIFIGAADSGEDADRIDRTDTALVQYVQQLAQHAFISEGETIQEGSGVNGMHSGRRVTRKLSAPS
jgi:hypothetical protein